MTCGRRVLLQQISLLGPYLRTRLRWGEGEGDATGSGVGVAVGDGARTGEVDTSGVADGSGDGVGTGVGAGLSPGVSLAAGVCCSSRGELAEWPKAQKSTKTRTTSPVTPQRIRPLAGLFSFPRVFLLSR